MALVLCASFLRSSAYSTPSHNTSRRFPPISNALWDLCDTVNVTLRDRVTFDDILKELLRNSERFAGYALCTIDFWLSG